MATYHYEIGAVRWRKHDGKRDVRAHRAPKGWSAFAGLLCHHPITGKPLRNGSQWWIRETYEGEKE